VGRRPVGVAQERVVVRDRGRAAAGARQRVREQRQPGLVGERRERRAEGRVALRAPGDDQGARVLLELGGEAVEQRRRGRRADPRARDPRAPAGASAPARLVRRQGRAGHERLTQHEVQVHGAGSPLERGPEGAAGELAQPAHALRCRGPLVDLQVPLRRAPVELDLVDGLAGADVAQLGRAVRGEDEQRHARLPRLDHRRRVVRRRRAGGARERDGQPARLREAEREERARALVEVRGAAQPCVAGQREHERRRA
jgi:hypothetical protein